MRSHPLLRRVRFLDLTTVVGNRYREETRPVEVDIGIEKVIVILVKCFGTRLWNIGIAYMLAHYRAILGLHQTIIIGVARPAFGKADQELTKKLGYRLIDKFGAIVGMKAPDDKGKADQHAFQYRHQVTLRYLFHRGYNLPLSDLVHGIDMVHTLLSIVVLTTMFIYVIYVIYVIIDSNESGAFLKMNPHPPYIIQQLNQQEVV